MFYKGEEAHTYVHVTVVLDYLDMKFGDRVTKNISVDINYDID